MSANKTQPTNVDVNEFIAQIENRGRREDAQTLLELMTKRSGEEARMWGPSIVGFGQYHYRYESGREGDLCRIGFAPRKANMVVYIMPGFDSYQPLLARLGKYRTGSSCLYLGRLNSIDLEVLGTLIDHALVAMAERYG